MVKMLTATKIHNIIGMLDTHLNQEVVDMMVNNKQALKKFHPRSEDPIKPEE